MILAQQQKDTDRLVRAFVEAGLSIAEQGERSWTLRPAGSRLTMTAFLDGDWLRFQAPLAGGRIHGLALPACAWELLERAADLCFAKIATPKNADQAQLAAEVPLDADLPLARAIAQIAAAFVGASAAIRGSQRTADPARANDAADVEATAVITGADLAQVCSAAQWAFNQRPDGRLAVPLESRAGFHEAIVEHTVRGVRARLDVPLEGELTEASRQAIGSVLLVVAGLHRMVRTAVDTVGDPPAAVLEVALGDAPTPELVAHALAALSLACDRCAREVKALTDDSLAKQYLAARGRSSRPTR